MKFICKTYAIREYAKQNIMIVIGEVGKFFKVK